MLIAILHFLADEDRPRATVAELLDALPSGSDLVGPGVVPVLAWRPDGKPPQDPRAAYIYAAVGRKP